VLHGLPNESVEEYVRISLLWLFPPMAFMSASKSDCTLQEPSGLVFPTANPKVPPAETASGVAASAIEAAVEKRMFVGNMGDRETGAPRKSDEVKRMNE